jgi:hypothetical protein
MTTVLDASTSPALSEGWIRAVLFDHAIDDWVDLGPDPIRRRHVGQIYADQVGAAYAAWKWLSDRAGTHVDTPPPDAQPVPAALALEVGVTTWTELMAALLTVGRAQALLFAEVAASGDTGTTEAGARRTFDRVGRDCAGHAALAFLEIQRGTFIDRPSLETAIAQMVPATRALLARTAVAEAWNDRITALTDALGLRL